MALCAGCRLGKNRVELIAKLASGPTRSYAAIKQALQAAQSNTFEQQFDLECDLQTSFGYTDYYVEAVRAFAEKRGPVFKGS
jgi:2-(1,2-epoxy-1,2-dihydrophenyl)acetyl-CoA isomerase